MTREEFINYIAPYIVIDSIERNYLPSPRIAQAVIESNKGLSDLANAPAFNLFGIKVNDQWQGKAYNKLTGECYNGKDYVSVNADFQVHGSWEQSVYFQGEYLDKRWISRTSGILRFANLKGVRDYKEFCRLLKEDGYATSPTYTQTLINKIEECNLTIWDSMTADEAEQLINKGDATAPCKLTIGLNAGHTISGAGSGAIGALIEGNETRNVVNALTPMLQALGCKVVDCTIDSAPTQADYLRQAVEKANRQDLDWFISIHFNAAENKAAQGTEVYTYEGKKYEDALDVCSKISKLGFKNRGVKSGSGLYVIRKTKAKSMLIEVCFVNGEDASKYKQVGSVQIAKAITEGLTGHIVENSEEDNMYIDTGSESKKMLYRVQTGSFKEHGRALAHAQAVKNKGFDTYIRVVNNLYKVQCGAFTKKENAVNLKNKLLSKNIDCFITV